MLGFRIMHRGGGHERDPGADWLYVVAEKGDPHVPADEFGPGADGDLVWVMVSYKWNNVTYAPGRYPIARVGNMTGRAVLPEEATVLTGIDHPMAALDKLRDMIYEGAA